MDNFEKHISSQIQNDKLDFIADSAIEDRLMYHMQLKSAKSAVRKNQIIPLFTALLATKLIAWKLGIASILLISFISYNQFQQEANYSIASDTAQILNVIDTTNVLITDSTVRY